MHRLSLLEWRMDHVAPELLAYYEQGKEGDRLAAGIGLVEFVRTIELVSRTLPEPPAVVADIGGGPGAYTGWLLDEGYRVIHRDVVADHVAQVAQQFEGRVDTALADARQLDLDDASVDAVLLLGPLYHLRDASERVRALGEAARVVKPGGVIHAAAISRWAPRLHGMLVERVHEKYPAILDLVDEMELTGWMAPLEPGGFNGYAHTPDELRSEVEAAGLAVESLATIEGISFALGDLDARLADPVERDLLLTTLRVTESIPALLGLGGHLLATARKIA